MKKIFSLIPGAVCLLAACRPSPAPVPAGPDPALEGLRREVAVLKESARTLERRVRVLEASRGAAAQRPAAATPPGEEPEKAVDAAGEAGEAPAAVPGGDPKIAEALDLLLDPATSAIKRQELWHELARKGFLDRTVAAYEARARENPANAEVQCDLGDAYLQKLQTVGDLEKGRWAMKADQAFDAALAADPAHWKARFQKAVSLSFWPAITGKGPECVRQFQTLIEQQEGGAAPRSEFAQSYLFLGNILQGQGKAKEAVEVLRRGARAYPEDPALAARLAELEEN